MSVYKSEPLHAPVPAPDLAKILQHGGVDTQRPSAVTPPARHDIHKGQNERETLCPIIGDEAGIHIQYLDEREVGGVRKARLKSLGVNHQI